MIIRKYRPRDERGWLECRVLAFLDTAYFDNVYREKEVYTHPSVELVAEEAGRIVGLLDIEYELESGTVCSRGEGRGAMIWHMAVLPQFRKQGIARQLLMAALARLEEDEIRRIEAWTRDDPWVNDWYIRQGFRCKQTYLHVYTSGDESAEAVTSRLEKLYVCDTFCHYLGSDHETIRKKFQRVHECRLYEKLIGPFGKP